MRLPHRESRILHVTDLDLLDGTPVLDLKPYTPAFDVFPVSRQGWLEDRTRDGGRADGRFAADQ